MIVGWSPFEPNDAARARFEGLKAAWQAIGASGLLMRPEYRHLGPTVQAWQDFEAAWERGDERETELTPQEAAARGLLEDFARAGLSNLDPDKLLRDRGADITQATNALKAAARADQAARAVESSAKQAIKGMMPLEYKIGAGVGLALLLLLALRR